MKPIGETLHNVTLDHVNVTAVRPYFKPDHKSRLLYNYEISTIYLRQAYISYKGVYIVLQVVYIARKY